MPLSAWKVVVTVAHESEPGKGFTLSLDRTPITIGALPENDVVLAHPWVSGAHAHVVVSHGTLVVQDHSRNGSFVAGRRVESTPLAPGDTLAIPPYRLSFELVGGAEERLTRAVDTPAGPPMPVTPRGPASAVPLTPPPLPPRNSVSLEVRDGPPGLTRQRLPLLSRAFTIGRDSASDLVLDLPMISRNHAELRLHGDVWAIHDLGSANGTRVNGQTVSEASLCPGDEVQLPGGVVLVLTAGNESPAAGAPPAPPPSRRNDGDATIRAGPGGAGRALQMSPRRAGPGSSVLILELAGRIDGYNYTELGQSLDALVDRGERLIAIDLTQVDFVDHTGLGVLVKAAAALEDAGGQLRLCGLSQRLSDSFSLSRLDVFFRGRIARDARAAVADLAGAAQR